MEPDWAAQHLHTIRTLMERASIYRRALAPVMLLAGCLGIAASTIACFASIHSEKAFVLFWVVVSVAGAAAAFLMVRWQALKASEPFWSLPTRRVFQSFLPPVGLGLMLALFTLGSHDAPSSLVPWLPPLWMGLYGCALVAAGFFMRRGIKLFGWMFLAASAISGVWVAFGGQPDSLELAHVAMGAAFGGLHLLYGLYLYFTEPKHQEA